MRLTGTGWKTEEYSDLAPKRASLIRDIDWTEPVYGETWSQDAAAPLSP